jgi:hypothetical protein
MGLQMDSCRGSAEGEEIHGQVLSKVSGWGESRDLVAFPCQ